MPALADPLKELDELESLDPNTGKPPESRLTSAKSLRSQYATMQQDDRVRNDQRAKIQALIDGAPPYDPSLLRQMGQGSRCNLNFGEADRYLSLAISGFVDLMQSVESLVNVSLPSIVDSGERYFHESNINTELTAAFRSWPGFYTNYLRLATTFVGHGVSVAIFPDSYGWQYKVMSLGQFFIPQNTPASPEQIDIATSYYDCPVVELYKYVADESVGKANGWNVEALRRAIIERANTQDKSVGTTHDWESVQRRIKNGDFSHGKTALTIRLILGWVREFDGSISYFATDDGGETDTFLCAQVRKYKKVEEAFNLFCYGVGSNGTYHSVRGLGQRIFAHCQVINRLKCQMVDGAMLAGGMIVQTGTVEQLQKLQVQNLGGITAFSPGITFQEKTFSPRLGDSVIPAVQELSTSLADNLDFYSAQGAAKGSPYRNKLQVEAELEQATRLTSASLSLFYASWTPLLREMVRRFILADDEVTRDFYKRLAARGTPKSVVKKIDVTRTTATRAIGGGNAAARTAGLNKLQERAALLPEDGRRNLTYDLVATEVGYDNASRYCSPAEQPRPTVDVSIASLENSALIEGKPQPVLTIQLHGVHLSIHAPEIQQITAGIEEGTIDGVQILPGLTELHNHSYDHLQLLAADPYAQDQVAEFSQILQQAGEAILNSTRQAEAEARKQAEAGDQGQQAVAEQLKLQTLQLKGEIEIRKAELALQMEQMKALQRQQEHDAKLRALDATTAAKILSTPPPRAEG